MNVFQKIRRAYLRLRVSNSPQVNLVWGFFLYSVIGVALLSLPWMQVADVGFIDNLFTGISAISTTGLMTISISDYSVLGQVVIMLLFQLGGIGYMTLTTYYLLFTTKRLTRWHRDLISAEFTMPDTIKITDFIKSVIIFTVIMETLGAVCFYIAFKGYNMPSGEAAWSAIFHSVSAFCTAGFSLNGSSFVEYQNDGFINAIISVLAIAGSLGFIFITDVWYRITGRSDKMSFTSKIVSAGFILLLFLGTVTVYFNEPSVNGTDDATLLQSFFQSMTAMTTVGFNTVDTGALSLPILLTVIFLMYVGASPSGTAGGLKITTLTAMLAVLKSRLYGQKKITFLGRRIPFERLYVATSTFIFYTSLIFVFTLLLAFVENIEFDRLLFEVASALGTVGLSTGITGDFSDVGKVLITILMFIGRVGVITFGFALLSREQKIDDHRESDLAV